MITPPSIPSSFAETLLRYMDEKALTAEELRKRLTQLSEQHRINQQTFTELLLSLSQIDPTPALGIYVGRMARPEDFGLVGYLLTACSTLGQALTRYGRFQPLVLSTLNTNVEKYRDIVSHQWDLGEVEETISAEFSVTVFITLYQTLIGKAIAPEMVAFPFAKPKHYKMYSAILGCPVYFDANKLQVDIPAKLMLMTISSSDPFLRRVFLQQAESMLTLAQENYKDSDLFVSQLQEYILEAIQDGDTRAVTVASRMNYSLRTFYRMLSQRDLNYRNVLAHMRKRLAKKYLADPRLTPTDVALLLGYSEQSAFNRAFKDWTGITPGAFRQRMLKP